MASATDGVRAHGILLTYAPLSKHGYCWYYVWQAYAAAGARTSMGSTPTALAAWNVTKGRHAGDWNPPPGAAIWLGRRRSDGNQDGDVFIAGAYDGDHAATDYPGWGNVGRVSINGRINQTGREYLGWSDHVLDCPITLGGEDMALNADTDYAAFSTMLGRALTFDARPNGVGADAKYGRTLWEQLSDVQNGIANIHVSADVDVDELASALIAQGITLAIVNPPAS